VEKREHSVRIAVAGVAPLLAAAALVSHFLWEFDAVRTSAAPATLIAAVAALIASAWAMLIAPSRALLVLGIASFVAASITLALWWDAMLAIAKTS